MSGVRNKKSLEAYVEASKAVSGAHYTLRLYITGATHHSMLAVRNIKAICDNYLKGRYNLEIIDVYQQPLLAEKEQIIAAPTLIKVEPKPVCRLIGDMSDTQKVLSGLDLAPTI